MIQLVGIGVKREDWIFRGIDLSVSEGEMIGIIGESGIGKTTLLEVISGLLDATEGEVKWKGQKIIGPTHKLIPGYEDIQIVNQDFKLEPYHTVSENIKEKVLHLPVEQQNELLLELLELVELTHLSHRKAKELSGGEQQRLSIARALACEPEILLLDEPFVHIDQRLRMKIMQYIVELNRIRKTTVMMVSHDGAELMGFVQKIIHLNQTGIVRMASSVEMYYQPLSRDQAELMGPINALDNGELLFRPNEYEVVKETNEGLAVSFIRSIDNGLIYYNYFGTEENKEVMLISTSVLMNVKKIKIKKRA